MFRFAAIAAAATIAAGTASAGIEGEYHTYKVGDTTFEGYVSRNTDLEQTRGTVLLVHDWDGMTDYEERRADMLAALGYTAFAIDVYGKDTDPQSVDEYKKLSGALYQDRELFRERLMGSLKEAANIPGATDNVVVAGYCFGGAAVLEMARAGAETQGFVTFHAGLGTPEGQDYAAVAAPVMIFQGAADPVSSMSQLAETIDGMQSAGKTFEVEVFSGARHSFTVWGSNDYDLRADEASWTDFKRFLDENI